MTFPENVPLIYAHLYSTPVPQTPEEYYQINLDSRESQLSILPYSQNGQVSISHAQSISHTPNFRFSEDCMAVNAPYQGQSNTYNCTSNAFKEKCVVILLETVSD